MVESAEGFLYPVIDRQRCVDCNLCQKVCPTQDINIAPIFHPVPEIVSAAWCKDMGDRLASTSGGAFYALASTFLEHGGIVFGVGYDKSMTVCHQRYDNVDYLKSARGSKYVQSRTGETFLQVKDLLRHGRKVLFSGTPCQIAGLRLFLRHDYDNLTTIDLVCHGVPSPRLFKEHLSWIKGKYGKGITDYKFRAKKRTGWRWYVRYVFSKEDERTMLIGKDFFSYAFDKGWLNRDSCYQCAFSRQERVSDITLSDFWGSESFSKILRRQRKYGYNLVMCNTPKGEKLLEASSGRLYMMKVPVGIAIAGDVRLTHPEPKPPLRDIIYKDVASKGYAYVAEHYKPHFSLLQRLAPDWAKNIIKEILCRI